jgi:hypothetical protein
MSNAKATIERDVPIRLVILATSFLWAHASERAIGKILRNNSGIDPIVRLRSSTYSLPLTAWVVRFLNGPPRPC